MKRIIILFLLISSFSFAQDLKLVKSTKQIINSGASPTSTTNYMVEIKKAKKCKVSIDSLVNTYTQKSSPFNIVKVDNPTVLSPNYEKVDASKLTDKGTFQITFSSLKSHGSTRPGAPPMNLMVPVAEFTQGAIIYYRVGKKKKQLVIELFEQLETINAP